MYFFRGEGLDMMTSKVVSKSKISHVYENEEWRVKIKIEITEPLGPKDSENPILSFLVLWILEVYYRSLHLSVIVSSQFRWEVAIYIVYTKI